MPPPVDLPVGPEPDWEQGEDRDNLKSTAESLVILQSLRQSRERWLSSTFPRFSSKARGGKVPHNSPPPHTIQTRGKCDLEIGPHIFPDTVFYEVHYLPSQSQHTPQPVTGWQSMTPHGGTYVSNAQSAQTGSNAEGSSTSSLETSSAPLISSLDAVTTITPILINQVNSAASSNPILANLLQLAAAGLATPEQLKTLGLLIQSLASPESAQLAQQPSLPTSQNQHNPTSTTISSPGSQAIHNSPVKEFDFVFEFREMPSERWVFPRGPVVYEKVIDSENGTSDALVKTVLPFDTSFGSGITNQVPPATSSSSNERNLHVATFRLRKAPMAVWDTIARWTGGEEKMQQSREFLNALDQTDRVYLGHRLSQGSLLTQLQNLVAPTFNLRTFKTAPVATVRTKRTALRKADSSASKKPDNTNPLPSQSAPSKRRKASQPLHGSVPAQIQCVSCKQTDVPLILGGRYCRPCVEAGRGTDTPQPYMSSYVPPSINIPESSKESRAPLHLSADDGHLKI